MAGLSRLSLILAAALLLAGFGWADARAAEQRGSSFGEIRKPQPRKPEIALNCVEPVDIMRRDHMKFLNQQRDATVLNGIRGGKYSLTGCIDCHNPADSGTVVRYENPEHFCAECHAYTSVKIDCFECHADRGRPGLQQGAAADGRQPPWRDRRELDAIALRPGAGNDN